MTVSFQEYMSNQSHLPRDEQVLIGRLELLEEFDRELVEAVVVRGQPTRALSRLMGKSQRFIRQKVLSLTRRISSGEFLAAARSLPYLPPDERLIVKRHFCQAATIRQLCAETGLTLHRLRRKIDQLRAKMTVLGALDDSLFSKRQWQGVQSAIDQDTDEVRCDEE